MCNSCGKGCTPIVTGPHVTRTQDVHGIPDTSKLENKTGALQKANQAAEKALIQAKQYTDSKLKGGGGDGDGNWETPEGAQKKVDAHSEKTKDVHGIKDTSKLVTEDEVAPLVDALIADALEGMPDGDGNWETPEGAQKKVDEHAEKTKGVHGIEDTAELVTRKYMRDALAELPTGGGGDGGGGTWETPMAAQEKADKALSDAKTYTDEHAEKTKDVHGIVDTAELATKADVKAVEDKIPAGGDGKTWETPEGAQAKVDEHAEKTKDVHGIVDTAQLVTKPELKAVEDKIGQGGGDGKTWETPEGAQAKVDAHAEKTKDVHGIADTTLLVTVEQLKVVEDKIGGGDGGGTWETPEAAQAKADKARDDAKAYADDLMKKHVEAYHTMVSVETGGITPEEGWKVALEEMRSIGGVHMVFVELERTGPAVVGRGIAQKAKDGLPEAGNVIPDMKIASMPLTWSPPKRLMVDAHSGYTTGGIRVTHKGEMYLADLTPENALRTGQHLVFAYEFIKPIDPAQMRAAGDGQIVEHLTRDDVQSVVDEAVKRAVEEALAEQAKPAAKEKAVEVPEVPAAKSGTSLPETRSVKVDIPAGKTKSKD